jgi:hypothetical protein
MMAFWEAAGLVGTIKLVNCDNAAAAALGGPAAQKRASNISQAGGASS